MKDARQRERTRGGAWRLALRKTFLFFPGLFLIALVPMVLDGPSRWNMAGIVTAAGVAVGCTPVVLLMFLGGDWLAKR